jgi:Rrf2 family iron-sulfur cluster assembly transcriptional regulator
MQISNSAYMGVEVLVRLVAYEPDRCCTAQALAEWINRSMSSTETLMSRLRAAGLVRARRGSGGGYHLNKPADMITVAEIFKAFDEPRVLSRRPLNAISLEPEALENLHGTDLLWEVLKSRILLFLSGVSLTDIATETAHPFTDDETDSNPAFEKARRSFIRANITAPQCLKNSFNTMASSRPTSTSSKSKFLPASATRS